MASRSAEADADSEVGSVTRARPPWFRGLWAELVIAFAVLVFTQAALLWVACDDIGGRDTCASVMGFQVRQDRDRSVGLVTGLWMFVLLRLLRAVCRGRAIRGYVRWLPTAAFTAVGAAFLGITLGPDWFGFDGAGGGLNTVRGMGVGACLIACLLGARTLGRAGAVLLTFATAILLALGIVCWGPKEEVVVEGASFPSPAARSRVRLDRRRQHDPVRGADRRCMDRGHDGRCFGSSARTVAGLDSPREGKWGLDRSPRQRGKSPGRKLLFWLDKSLQAHYVVIHPVGHPLTPMSLRFVIGSTSAPLSRLRLPEPGVSRMGERLRLRRDLPLLWHPLRLRRRGGR